MNLFRLKFSMILIGFFITNQNFSMEEPNIKVILVEITDEEVKKCGEIIEKIDNNEKINVVDNLKLGESADIDKCKSFKIYESEINEDNHGKKFLDKIYKELENRVYIYGIGVFYINVDDGKKSYYSHGIYRYTTVKSNENNNDFYKFSEKHIKEKIVYDEAYIINTTSPTIYIYYSKKKFQELENKDEAKEVNHKDITGIPVLEKKDKSKHKTTEKHGEKPTSNKGKKCCC